MTYALAWRPAQEFSDIDEEPFDVWRDDDGGASTLFYRTAGGFLLRFIDGADFGIDLATRRVTCTPLPDVSRDYAENIFSNQVLPLLWTYEGTPVLHASCVVIDGGAFGFLGRSGRGKSTLAAAFARFGHAFLTDDGMVIERAAGEVQVRPYLPSIRLLPDSQGAVLGPESVPAASGEVTLKARVSASSLIPHTRNPAPLRGIYVLDEPASDAPMFKPMTVPAAIDALLQHSFLLDSHDKTKMRSHFKVMADLAEGFPVFALDYPRDFDRLEDTVAVIASHARTKECPK